MSKTVVIGYDLAADYSYTFKDVPKNHWAQDYISTIASYRVANGYEDGTFKPSNSVTRAQFAKFLIMQLI
jgi:hypothetical protein